MFHFRNPLEPIRRHVSSLVKQMNRQQQAIASIQEALGRIESRQCTEGGSLALADNEFKVSSQWGEDGILQFLLRRVAVPRKVFVEIGVENYTEANTRFLVVKDNWSGLIIDGSEANIEYIKRDPIYWRHNLKACSAFVTRENVNELLSKNGLCGEIGILSIDIDGNDYWVWERLDAVNPTIVIVEYNALFGAERAVAAPYDPDFVREKAHHSHAYYGASLPALVGLGRRKGYAFVGSNSAGNNAFFVRRDSKPAELRELTAAEGRVSRQFRETRDANGKLAHASPEEEEALVRSLPCVEVEP